MNTTQSRDNTSHDTPWIAIADLHGRRAQFTALLSWAERTLGPDLHVCTLGDYVDNGPDIPALLGDLIALRERLGSRFIPIMGNHDLALLRSLGWPGSSPDPDWYEQWHGYWDHGLGTPEVYGASTLEEFSKRFPAAHRAFLEALPWHHDTGRWLFVHAGMEPGDLTPQRAMLAEKRLPEGPLHTPRQLRDKALSDASDATWDRVGFNAREK